MRSPDILIFMLMASDIITCMYDTGLDPFTGQELHVGRHLGDRKVWRAPVRFFKPENSFEIREAPLEPGKQS
jgi:hypothetical protein